MSSELDLTMPLTPSRAQTATRRFTRSAGDWFTRSARRVGGAWQAELRLGRLRKPVAATIGDPWVDGDTVWRSLSWTPTRIEGPQTVDDRRLPSFTGQIGLRGDADHQALVLKGTYEPPGGALGTALDVLVLNKVAEITGLQLLSDIAHRLSLPEGLDAPVNRGVERP